MYNSCTGVITNTNFASDLTAATTSSTAQSTWNNDMQFNPVVEFWYNQDYLQNVGDLSSGWAKFTNLTDESDTSKNTIVRVILMIVMNVLREQVLRNLQNQCLL